MNDAFIKSLKKEKANMILPRSDVLHLEAVGKILELVEANTKLSSIDQAKTVVAVLFQQGGTARACDGNLSITLFDKQIKLATIRKSLKDASYNRGERKLARTIATDIQKICFELDIPGNLFQKISRTMPDRTFTAVEKSWLSDFQSTNEDAPSYLRAMITESFNKKPLPVISKQKRTGK